MNKPLNNTDTQKIKFSKSNNYYGDNFDGGKFCTNNPTNNPRENNKNNTFYEQIQNKPFTIISTCIFVIIIIGIVIGIVSLSSSTVEKNEETINSSFISTSKEEKNYTIPINNEYYNEDTQPESIFSEKMENQVTSTEFVTAIQPTTQVTEIDNQTETTNSTIISFEEKEKEEATTYIGSSLSVDDISLSKTDDNLFLCTIYGTFDEYSEVELLNLVSISSTIGTPTMSSPSLNGSNFSFYIKLSDECDGELCIRIGKYAYYQKIRLIK